MAKTSKSKQKIIDKKVGELNNNTQNISLTQSFDANVEILENIFMDIDTVIFKKFGNLKNPKLQFCLISAKGLVNKEIIANNIIKPLMECNVSVTGDVAANITDKILQVEEVKTATGIQQVIQGVTYGDSALIVSGSSDVILISAKKFALRSIEEPDSEKVLKGPKEGFNECVVTNISMMHRKLRTNDFKVKLLSCGDASNTQVAVCYMDSYVNKDILNLLLEKLNQAQLDNVLDSNYIAEMIREKNLSPFRVVGTTERPDSLAGKILEGRIGILVDGSPVALTVPRLFIENFQNPEDYYVNFYYATFARLLRMVAFFLAIATPAAYVAIEAYHHEMFPTNLLINITIERQSVPLPVALEAVIMLLVFDILRETGVRMPQSIGQALSIVGALVIGQSAVEAKLVAAPMIIVVAFTGITSLLIPKLSGAIILCRYFLIALASILGFVGLVIGFSMILIHLCNLSSFGVPQLSPLAHLKYLDIKDVYIRAPMWSMKQTDKKTAVKKTGIIDSE